MATDKESYISDSDADIDNLSGYEPQGLPECDHDSASHFPTAKGGRGKETTGVCDEEARNNDIVYSYLGNRKRPDFTEKLPKGYEAFEKFMPKLAAHCPKSFVSLDLLRGTEPDPSKLSDDRLQVRLLGATRPTVEQVNTAHEGAERIVKLRLSKLSADLQKDPEAEQSIRTALALEIGVTDISAVGFYRRTLQDHWTAQNVLLFRDLQACTALTERTETVQRVAKFKSKYGENGIKLLLQVQMESLGATSVAGIIKKLKQKLKEVRKTRPSTFEKPEGWMDKLNEMNAKLAEAGSTQHDTSMPENHAYHITKVNSQLLGYPEWSQFCVETFNLEAKSHTESGGVSRYGETWDSFSARQVAFATMLRNKSESEKKHSATGTAHIAKLTAAEIDEVAVKAGYVKKPAFKPKPTGKGKKEVPVCSKCNKPGHLAKNCWAGLSDKEREAARKKYFEARDSERAARSKQFSPRNGGDIKNKVEVLVKAAVSDAIKSSPSLHLLDLAGTESVKAVWLSTSVKADWQTVSYRTALVAAASPPCTVRSISIDQYGADITGASLVSAALKEQWQPGLPVPVALVDTNGVECARLECTLECAQWMLNHCRDADLELTARYILDGEDEYLWPASQSQDVALHNTVEDSARCIQKSVRNWLQRGRRSAALRTVVQAVQMYCNAVVIQRVAKVWLARKEAERQTGLQFEALVQRAAHYPYQCDSHFIGHWPQFRASIPNTVYTTGAHGLGYYRDPLLSGIPTGNMQNRPNAAARRNRRLVRPRVRVISDCRKLGGVRMRRAKPDATLGKVILVGANLTSPESRIISDTYPRRLAKLASKLLILRSRCVLPRPYTSLQSDYIDLCLQVHQPVPDEITVDASMPTSTGVCSAQTMVQPVHSHVYTDISRNVNHVQNGGFVVSKHGCSFPMDNSYARAVLRKYGRRWLRATKRISSHIPVWVLNIFAALCRVPTQLKRCDGSQHADVSTSHVPSKQTVTQCAGDIRSATATHSNCSPGLLAWGIVLGTHSDAQSDVSSDSDATTISNVPSTPVSQDAEQLNRVQCVPPTPYISPQSSTSSTSVLSFTLDSPETAVNALHCQIKTAVTKQQQVRKSMRRHLLQAKLVCMHNQDRQAWAATCIQAVLRGKFGRELVDLTILRSSMGLLVPDLPLRSMRLCHFREHDRRDFPPFERTNSLSSSTFPVEVHWHTDPSLLHVSDIQHHYHCFGQPLLSSANTVGITDGSLAIEFALDQHNMVQYAIVTDSERNCCWSQLPPVSYLHCEPEAWITCGNIQYRFLVDGFQIYNDSQQHWCWSSGGVRCVHIRRSNVVLSPLRGEYGTFEKAVQAAVTIQRRVRARSMSMCTRRTDEVWTKQVSCPITLVNLQRTRRTLQVETQKITASKFHFMQFFGIVGKGGDCIPLDIVVTLNHAATVIARAFRHRSVATGADNFVFHLLNLADQSIADNLMFGGGHCYLDSWSKMLNSKGYQLTKLQVCGLMIRMLALPLQGIQVPGLDTVMVFTDFVTCARQWMNDSNRTHLKQWQVEFATAVLNIESLLSDITDANTLEGKGYQKTCALGLLVLHSMAFKAATQSERYSFGGHISYLRPFLHTLQRFGYPNFELGVLDMHGRWTLKALEEGTNSEYLGSVGIHNQHVWVLGTERENDYMLFRALRAGKNETCIAQLQIAELERTVVTQGWIDLRQWNASRQVNLVYVKNAAMLFTPLNSEHDTGVCYMPEFDMNGLFSTCTICKDAVISRMVCTQSARNYKSMPLLLRQCIETGGWPDAYLNSMSSHRVYYDLYAATHQGLSKSKWYAMNHSVNPNCQAVLENGEVVWRALVDILPKMQLTYDYGSAADLQIVFPADVEAIPLEPDVTWTGGLFGDTALSVDNVEVSRLTLTHSTGNHLTLQECWTRWLDHCPEIASNKVFWSTMRGLETLSNSEADSIRSDESEELFWQEYHACAIQSAWRRYADRRRMLVQISQDEYKSIRDMQLSQALPGWWPGIDRDAPLWASHRCLHFNSGHCQKYVSDMHYRLARLPASSNLLCDWCALQDHPCNPLMQSCIDCQADMCTLCEVNLVAESRQLCLPCTHRVVSLTGRAGSTYTRMDAAVDCIQTQARAHIARSRLRRCLHRPWCSRSARAPGDTRSKRKICKQCSINDIAAHPFHMSCSKCSIQPRHILQPISAGPHPRPRWMWNRVPHLALQTSDRVWETRPVQHMMDRMGYAEQATGWGTSSTGWRPRTTSHTEGRLISSQISCFSCHNERHFVNEDVCIVTERECAHTHLQAMGLNCWTNREASVLLTLRDNSQMLLDECLVVEGLSHIVISVPYLTSHQDYHSSHNDNQLVITTPEGKMLEVIHHRGQYYLELASERDTVLFGTQHVNSNGTCFVVLMVSLLGRAQVTDCAERIEDQLRYTFILGLQLLLPAELLCILDVVWNDYCKSVEDKYVGTLSPTFVTAVKFIKRALSVLRLCGRMDERKLSCLGLFLLTCPFWGPDSNCSAGGGHVALFHVLLTGILEQPEVLHSGFELGILSVHGYYLLKAGSTPRTFLGTAGVHNTHTWELGVDRQLDEDLISAVSHMWNPAVLFTHMRMGAPVDLRGICRTQKPDRLTHTMGLDKEDNVVLGRRTGSAKCPLQPQHSNQVNRRVHAQPCAHYGACKSYVLASVCHTNTGPRSFLCPSCEEFDLGHDPDKDRCEGCTTIPNTAAACYQCRTRGYCDIHGDLSTDTKFFVSTMMYSKDEDKHHVSSPLGKSKPKSRCSNRWSGHAAATHPQCCPSSKQGKSIAQTHLQDRATHIQYSHSTGRCGLYTQVSFSAGECVANLLEPVLVQNVLDLPLELLAALKGSGLPHTLVHSMPGASQSHTSYCYDAAGLSWNALAHCKWFHIAETSPDNANVVQVYTNDSIEWIATRSISSKDQILLAYKSDAAHQLGKFEKHLQNNALWLRYLSPVPVPRHFNLELHYRNRARCEQQFNKPHHGLAPHQCNKKASPGFQCNSSSAVSQSNVKYASCALRAMTTFPRRPRVLSMCDGDAGGLVAMQLAKIDVEVYFASEISSFGMRVGSVNHQGHIVYVGDLLHLTQDMISNVIQPDIVLCGFPCTNLSKARTNGGGVAEGLQGKQSRLFFDCVRILRWCQAYNPQLLFMFENVVPATSKDEERISHILGVNPLTIDAHHFTPGRRTRKYWINWRTNALEPPSKENVPPLQDMLVSGTPIYTSRGKAYCILAHPSTQCNRTRVKESDGTVRFLYPQEEARILGFSDTYLEVSGVSETQKHRLCGEGFSIPVVAAILAPLQKVFTAKSETEFRAAFTSIYLQIFDYGSEEHLAWTEHSSHHMAQLLEDRCRECGFWEVENPATISNTDVFTSAMIDSAGRHLAMLDSGCSTSITGDKTYLSNVEECHIQANMASGHCVVEEKGRYKGPSATGHIFDLPECLYHPQVEHTLFAVAQLAQLGYTFTMGTTCILRAPDGSDIPVIMLFGVPWVELQRVQITPVVHARQAESLQVWHNRLHCPTEQIIAMANDPHSGVVLRAEEARNPPVIHCRGCNLGNFRQSKIEENQSSPPELGAVVSADTYFVNTPSIISGRDRAVVFVEGKTGYIFFAATADLTAATIARLFLTYKAEVTDPRGLVILRHHSDQGKEFTAEQYKVMLNALGIQATVSVAYCHWQNGRAEVRWRMLRNLATSMRLHAGADKRFWELAFVYAAYCINHRTGKKGEPSPYTQLTGNQNFCGLMRTFGCACVARFPLQTLHGEGHDKLDEQAFEGIFVGMAGEPLTLNQPAYLIYIPTENRLVAVRFGNVKFQEQVLPLRLDPSPVFETQGPLFGDVSEGRAQQDMRAGPDSVTDVSHSEGAVDSEGVTNMNHSEGADGSNSSEGAHTTPHSLQSQEGENMNEASDATMSDGIGMSKVVNDNIQAECELLRTGIPEQCIKSVDVDSAEYKPFTGYTVFTGQAMLQAKHANSKAECLKQLIQQVLASIKPSQFRIHHWKYAVEPKYFAIDKVVVAQGKQSSTVEMVNRLKNRHRNQTAAVNMLATLEQAMVCTNVCADEHSLFSFLTSEDAYIQQKAMYTVISGDDCAGNAQGIPTPKSRKQAMSGPWAEEWRQGELEEATSLIESGTFEPMLWTEGMHVIGSLWVYKIKTDAVGNIVRFKVRLCVLGNRQVAGVDFTDTFAAVMTHSTLRLMIALSASLGWALTAADVDTAFLNAKLDQTVYMWPPDPFKKVDERGNKIVLKLKRSLYGLKQAPFLWAKDLTDWLLSLGFKQCVVEPCLYILRDRDDRDRAGTNLKSSRGTLVIGCYVDDIVMLSSNESCRKWFMDKFQGKYKVKDLGKLEWCLGMQVQQTASGIHLNQTQYIKDMLIKFGMDDTKLVSVPMSSLFKPLQIEAPIPGTTEHKECQQLPYRELVGSLLYCLLTRPDVGFAVSSLAQHMQNWSAMHYKAATRVLRYLGGTKDLGIVYRRQPHTNSVQLCACSDAEYAGQTKDGKSITGWAILLGKSVIAAKSKKQPVVALSTAEAEYIALAAVVQEVLYTRNILEFLGLGIKGPTPVYVDNRACKLIAEGQTTVRGVKHINVRYHFVKEAVRLNQIELFHVRTDQLPADLLTKPLSEESFEKHRKALLGTDATWIDSATRTV